MLKRGPHSTFVNDDDNQHPANGNVQHAVPLYGILKVREGGWGCNHRERTGSWHIICQRSPKFDDNVHTTPDEESHTFRMPVGVMEKLSFYGCESVPYNQAGQEAEFI